MGMAARKLIRVQPYHAAGPSAPTVWHDRSDCEQGRWIPSVSLRAGTGPGEQCPECARLDAVEPIDTGWDPVVERVTKRPRTPLPASVPKVERVMPQERQRPRMTTAVGVAASVVLAVFAGLWVSGGLERHNDENTKPPAPVSTSTTRRATPFASSAASAAVKPVTAPTLPPAPAPTQPAVTSGATSAPPNGGTFYMGTDGYTHGTEDDGEVCSNNPDDPQFPCSYQVPGSDGFGAPLPEDRVDSSAAAPNAARQSGTSQDPAATAAAREQRRAERQLLRSSRRP
jgi:hypothetical protein